MLIIYRLTTATLAVQQETWVTAMETACRKYSPPGPLLQMIADLSSSSSNQLLFLYCLRRPGWSFSRPRNTEVISSSGLLCLRTQWPWSYNSDRKNQDLGDLEHITFCGPSFLIKKKEYKTTFVNFVKISAIHVNILPGVLQVERPGSLNS